MEKGLRYVLTHIGDITVDSLTRGCHSLTTSTCGVRLTYDIREQERKKRSKLGQIGERVAELKAVSPDNEIFNDEKLKELFCQLDEIEARIQSNLREREIRLYPGRAESASEV